MVQRSTLSEKLHEICEHVYFQPPESLKLVYPCIVYFRTTIQTRFADGKPYTFHDRYSIRYISRTEDSEIVRQIAQLESCSAGQFYTSDNLYHYPFTITI